MSEPIQAYPLQWPAGWKRTASRADAKFRKGKGGWTESDGAAMYRSAERVPLGEGIHRVRRELRAFGIPDHRIVISSDLRLRLDGLPAASQSTARMDPGVAVYWTDGGRKRCIAIDRYTRIADNMAAIAATLSAMRAIERHGGAAILDRAFTGFTALPAPEQWFTVLEVSSHASKEEIEEAFRRKAMKAHPDRGGTHSDMARLNWARDAGLSQ